MLASNPIEELAGRNSSRPMSRTWSSRRVLWLGSEADQREAALRSKLYVESTSGR